MTCMKSNQLSVFSNKCRPIVKPAKVLEPYVIFVYWHDRMRSLSQGVRILNFEEKKQIQKTETKQANKKNLVAVFCLIEECPKLLSSLEIDHRRRKTIPLWKSSGGK